MGSNRVFPFSIGLIFLYISGLLATPESSSVDDHFEFAEIQPEQINSGNLDYLFSLANDLYIQGEYDEAAGIYEQIISSGHHSADLLYNLGNTYYRLNRIPQAILYYERAALLAPSDEDIRFNLELAYMRTKDRIEELPVFFINRWWNSARGLMNFGDWAAISIISFIGFLILISFFLISRSVAFKKAFFWTGVTLFFISVSSFSLGLDQRNYLRNHNTAIVFAPVLQVKSSPDINSAGLFIIHAGTKVHVEDSLGNWRAVRISDGNKGWVKREAIEMI